MNCELELNDAVCAKLAETFRLSPRVDMGIDSLIERRLGRAFADDRREPRAFRLEIGPFAYFAGDATSPGSRGLMAALAPRRLMMPSPPTWHRCADAVFGDRLIPLMRYRFDPEPLTEAHLRALLASSRHTDSIAVLDAERANRLLAREDSYLDIEGFASLATFLAEGLGFAVLDGERCLGVAYSSLACSRGIEVSVYVEPEQRRRGLATALASRLLLECLCSGVRPNWDAANPASYKLALKLGLAFVETYNAYYHEDA
jgi:GNAT superfamily N-acetyltransferase